jgi:hypothetical protein
MTAHQNGTTVEEADLTSGNGVPAAKRQHHSQEDTRMGPARRGMDEECATTREWVWDGTGRVAH